MGPCPRRPSRWNMKSWWPKRGKAANDAQLARGRSRGQRCRAGAAPPRMDRDPPARRPAAGRLPHPDARRRPGPGRPARVPAPRRRAPHRLERHGAAADAACARLHRRPRDGGLVPAGPEPARSTSARATRRKRKSRPNFVGVLARLLTRHGNRVGAMLYGSGVDAVIPPRSGRRHVLHLLHAMQRRAAERAPDSRARPGCADLLEVGRRR